MEDLTIDIARTALVLIDLQHYTVSKQLAPYSGQQVVGNCVLLAQEMRNRGGMVVYVHVLVNELLQLPADAPMRPPGSPPPLPDASRIVFDAGVEATDYVVTKRQWGAFYGTGLDQILRRRDIDTLVMGGLVTNYGVESTAREGFDRGYALVFAEDAMSGASADLHHFACNNVFRTMGRVRATKRIIDALQAGTGEA